ncbi:MAG: glutamine amidotransferase [Clostridia bacterium]|nr:glutamine amidotransferase [Clostridia bacterium]
MRILHLYYDIMNLYGEYANVRAMERMMEKNGIEYSTDRLSFGDKAVLSDYDFIYIGSGTERNRNVVLEDMRKYRDELNDCIAAGKVILMTGNSFEMLGKSIKGADGNVVEGLDIFDFTTTEQNKTRNTADAIFSADFLDSELVGFINKCSETEGIEEPLFTVKMGLGNKNDGSSEGIRRGNFFGTHLTGPVLIKNPHFLVYMAKLAAGTEKLSAEHLKYENAGYKITLKELSPA